MMPTLSHPRYSLGRFSSAACLALALSACARSGGSVEPPPGLPLFSYPSRVLLAEVGLPFSGATPSSTGTGNLDFWSLSGSLPPGVTFDFSSGSFQGTPTAIASPRILTVTATNTHGTFETILSLAVCGTPRFAYSANAGDNTVSTLQVNDALGTFEHRGHLAQLAGEANPNDVQADPHGRILYVLNDFALTPYLVDQVTGALTVGTPVSIGTGPHSLLVHPGGEFVFVASSSTDRVRWYTVDPFSGELSHEPGDQVSTNLAPSSLAGDPAGRYLVVGHENSTDYLLSFMIDDSTGALTLADTVSEGSASIKSLEIAPLGEQLYAVLSAGGFDFAVRFPVDPTTGAMGLGPGWALPTSGPREIVLEPGGNYAYVVNETSAEITYYSVSSENGNLTELGNLPSTSGARRLRFAGNGLQAVLVDTNLREARLFDRESDGSLTETSSLRLRPGPSALAIIEGTEALTRRVSTLYSLNGDGNDISIFQVDAISGAVSASMPQVPTGVGPVDLVIDPLGRFAYVSNGNDPMDFNDQSIGVYSMDASGNLIDNFTPKLTFGLAPTALAIDPSGRFLYAHLALPGSLPSVDRWVAWYEILPDGSLGGGATHALTNGLHVPEALVIDHAGLYLYYIDGGQFPTTTVGNIEILALDREDGSATTVQLVAANAYPTNFELSANGKRGYTAQNAGNLAVSWEVGLDGVPVFNLPATQTQNRPVDLALTPNQSFGFVACNDPMTNGSLLVYDIDPATGALTDTSGSPGAWRHEVSAGMNPIALELSLDGNFAFVLSETSEDLHIFSIDQSTGAPALPPQVISSGLSPIELRRRIAVE